VLGLAGVLHWVGVGWDGPGVRIGEVGWVGTGVVRVGWKVVRGVESAILRACVLCLVRDIGERWARGGER
jgi:hypothetical protein